MLKILIFMSTVLLSGCFDDPVNLINQSKKSHDAELRAINDGWYLNESYFKSLSKV